MRVPERIVRLKTVETRTGLLDEAGRMARWPDRVNRERANKSVTSRKTIPLTGETPNGARRKAMPRPDCTSVSIVRICSTSAIERTSACAWRRASITCGLQRGAALNMACDHIRSMKIGVAQGRARRERMTRWQDRHAPLAP